MEEQVQADTDEPGVPLCPGCMAENDPAADFCERCGHPLSTMASIDPLRRTLSVGHWYRTAASGRVPPIVFWTTWVLLIPTGGFLMAAMLDTFFSRDPDRPILLRVLSFLICGVVLTAYIAILYRMTANYRAHRRSERETSD